MAKLKIIHFQKICRDEDFRIEAEYWNSNKNKLALKASEAISFSQYGTSKTLNEDKLGFPILRLNEFDSFFIGEPQKYTDKIDQETFFNLKLKNNDVLICRTNGNPKYVGRASIVPEDYDYGFASYLFRVRPDSKIINSATLVAYLNSKYGREEIEKYSLVSNQANFSPAKFRKIKLPQFSSILQEKIEDIIFDSYNYLKLSKKKYKDAERNLLDLLEFGGLSKQRERKQISIKSLKEIESFNRLDAEYYQPVYDKIENNIFDNFLGRSIFDSNIEIIDASFSAEAQKKYKYIELSNIGDYGEIKDFTEDIGSKLPSRARRLVRTGDVLISSLEGSIEKCAVITEEFEGAICSTGFFVLRSEDISPYYLLLLLKSEIMQSLLKKRCSGTIMPSIGKGELESLLIPQLQSHSQQKISNTVKSSISFRKRAIELNSLAQKAVEIAIEEGEDEALTFIDKNL